MSSNDPVAQLVDGTEGVLKQLNTLTQQAETGALGAVQGTQDTAVSTLLAALNDVRATLEAPLRAAKKVVGK